MRADFQQYYGLDLDKMGGDYSIRHAACLAAHLPKDSRTFVAVNPLCEYASTTNRLLAMIEYHAHAGWWVHTEDARRGRNAPQFVAAAETGEPKKTQGESLFIDEYMEILAKPRKEVQHV